MHDGRNEQRTRLLALKQSRAAAFRSEVFPYFRYVAQSGFGLLAGSALFLLLIAYVNLLKDIPADAPIGLAGSVAIALAAVWTPMRTYLGRADSVFLLPMETAVLREYIRPLIYRAGWAGIFRTLAVYVVFLPLYVKAPDSIAAAAARPLWLLGAALAALAAWNAYGAWRERQTVHAAPRLLLRMARYAFTLLSAWALVNAAPVPAFVLTAGLIALAAALGRLPRRQALPWEKLIREEEAARRRWYRFLGWFVDTPSEESRPSRRRWAVLLGNWLPWDRSRAWHYLYAKTFARSDTLGALTWWHAVVGFAVLAMDDPAADWIACGIGMAVSGMQLMELRGHRLSLIVETLPLDRKEKRLAAASVARAAGTAGTVLLWLLTAVPQGWPMPEMAAVMLAAGLIWNGWLIPRRLAHAMNEDDD